MNKPVTVYELYNKLGELISEGYGENIVNLSVNWDRCDHVQGLSGIYWNESLKWVTLVGGKDLNE